MKLTAAIAERDRVERERERLAGIYPHRRGFADPYDPRLENPLGRLRAAGKITESEYSSGVKWRSIYWAYLSSIGAPLSSHQNRTLRADVGVMIRAPSLDEYENSEHRREGRHIMPLGQYDDRISMSFEDCADVAASFKRGIKILESRGKRVLHAVNALVVWEEPEELGDFEFTAKAAQKGLAALASEF